LHLGSIQTVRSAAVTVDGASIPATFAAEETGWTILFSEELLLKAGRSLIVRTS
jgi:hypothetical protein